MPELNMNNLACFLPFNKTVTEDLTGNIEVEVIGPSGVIDYWGESEYLSLRQLHYSKPDKSLYILNHNTNACLKLKNSENWNFDNQDFTISFWYKPICYLTHISNDYTYFDSLFASETDTYLGIANAGNEIRYHIRNAANTYWHEPYHSNIVLTNNKWYHVAMCRQGTVVYGFLNGVKNYEADIGTSILNRPIEPFYIGRWGSNAFGGEFCMAEFIVDIGHCWYTDNFTPQSFLDNTLLTNNSLSE